MPAQKIIDINIDFDFTSDTSNYWKNFWDNRDGLGCGSSDPDAKSKTLQLYHQFLWSKKLPNGDIMSLEALENSYGYYLKWKDFCFSSDAMINGYRWKRLKPLMQELENIIPDYKAYQEKYIRKSYTIGGMIIFPQRKWGINQSRGCNSKIYDRIDLTIECIRKYYNNEDNPLFSVLEDDSKFFELFVDFKGFIDFFYLQDIVSEDYKKTDIYIGNGDFNDNPLPQNIDEWFIWHDKTIKFIEDRNLRIAKALLT